MVGQAEAIDESDFADSLIRRFADSLQEQIEHQSHEKGIESINLRDHRLRPEGAREGEGQSRQQADGSMPGQMHQAEVEADDGQAGEEGRDEIDPISDVADGEQRGELPQENVQRVAGRVSNPQGVGDNLELETVGLAQGGREGAQIDGEGQGEEDLYKSKVQNPRSKAKAFPEQNSDFEGDDQEETAAQQHLGLQGVHFPLGEVEE